MDNEQYNKELYDKENIIQIGKWYSHTITLSPSKNMVKIKTQYDNLKDEVQRMFKKLHIKDYHYYPEFTDRGNIHFHGVFRFHKESDTMGQTDLRKFKKHVMAKIVKEYFKYIGIMDISIIRDSDKWYDYCNKEWKETGFLPFHHLKDSEHETTFFQYIEQQRKFKTIGVILP